MQYQRYPGYKSLKKGRSFLGSGTQEILKGAILLRINYHFLKCQFIPKMQSVQDCDINFTKSAINDYEL